MKKKYLFLPALLVLAAGCAPKIVPGSPEFRQRIRGGDILIWSEPAGPRGLNQVYAAGGATASVDGAWEAITDVERFPEFLFGMIEVKVVDVADPSRPVADRVVDFRINAPFPFNDIRSRVRLTCDAVARSCDFRAIEGNLKELYGGFRVEEWGDGFVAITFRTYADFEYIAVPAKVSNEVTEFMVSKWADDMKARVLQEPWVNMQPR